MIFLCKSHETSNNIQRLGVVHTATSAIHREQLNGEFILEFDGLLDEQMAPYIDDVEVVYEARGNYFDVVRSESTANSDGTYTITADAEHVSYRLNDEEQNIENYDRTDTPQGHLTHILIGTDFTVGQVGGEVQFVRMQSQGDVSRRRLLMELATLTNMEIEFEKFIIHLRQPRGNPSPRPLVHGRHVNVISRGFDRSNLDDEGNPERFFSCESLYLPMNEYNLGDAFHLMNEKLGIKIDKDRVLRLVSITHDPYDDTNITFELYTGPQKWHGRGIESLFDEVADPEATHPSIEAIRAVPFDPYQDELETDFLTDRIVDIAHINPGWPGHDAPEEGLREYVEVKGNNIRFLQSRLVEHRKPFTDWSQVSSWWNDMPPEDSHIYGPDGFQQGIWPEEEWGSRAAWEAIHGTWDGNYLTEWPVPFVPEGESDVMTPWVHRDRQVYWMFAPNVPVFVGVLRNGVRQGASTVVLWEISSSTEIKGSVILGDITIQYTGIQGNTLTGVTGVTRSFPAGTTVYRTVTDAEWDGPHTPMTKDDPVLFNPPDYGSPPPGWVPGQWLDAWGPQPPPGEWDGSWMPPQARGNIDNTHRLAHRIMLWNISSRERDQVKPQPDPPPVGGGAGYIEIWRRIPTAPPTGGGESD